jgi:O-antigen ligase
MVNIYSFTKQVFQNLQKENKSNTLFTPVLFLFITLPLSLALNNISLGVFVFFSIIYFKKINFKIQGNLVYLIMLYLLMVASLFWTINTKETLHSLSKEIGLLLLPFGFMMMKKFTTEQKKSIIKYYSYTIVLFVLYYLIRAIIRFLIFQNTSVFFCHSDDSWSEGLVPKVLNTTYTSVFVAIAFFYFFVKEYKVIQDVLLMIVLFTFILLLSSKSIIVIIIILMTIHLLFFSKTGNRMRLRNIVIFISIIGVIAMFGKIKQRFQIEFQTNDKHSINTNVVEEGVPAAVHYVSIKEAWLNESFTPNDRFPGTAFRVYQFRIFLEILKEQNIFFTGLGLNASYAMIEQKANQYNLYKGNGINIDSGYQTKNFHNQYIQNFAELGILGFLLLIIILSVNLRNALKSKDFIHFAFAVLMISLFLTESFFCRQRGVMFFATMYCLFNSKALSEKK